MSLSLANADIYISRIVGGANDTNVRAMARDALGATMEEWMHRNTWKFLLLDTSNSFAVVSSATSGDPTLTTAVTNGFKNVLVGMTVTGTDIPASTTVSSITSNTSLELSANPTGNIVAASITFGGTIPIIDGTASYTLPARFWKPHSCRLTSASKRPLAYITQYDYDAVSWDQSVEGYVGAYTVYTDDSFDASGTQQSKIKFIRVPSQNDVALLRYYRMLEITTDPVDVPDGFLYTLLDCARVRLLETKNATDNRIPVLKGDAEIRLRRAIATDRDEGGQDQMDTFHTPGEIAVGAQGPPFFPRGDMSWGPY